MVYTMAKGRFPKKPEETKILEICRKDFRNFKEDNGNKIIENLEFQINDNALLNTPNSILIAQKENLELIRELIHEGREDYAFSLFFRTYPSCLPHRSRNI
ncbi:MAG: hypothetical protein ACFFD2_25000 [Promethearchaeota archaeon]